MKCLIYVEVYLHGMYGPFVGTRACILDGEIIYSWMLYNSIGQGCALFLYTIATYPLPL